MDSETLAKSVWFLDYDGSLCPHQEAWEAQAYDTAEIQTVVERLARVTRGVFWNTGRRVESLATLDDRFLTHSGYFVQGSIHWDADSQTETLLAPRLDGPYKLALLDHFKDLPKFRVEIKPTSARVAPMDLAFVSEIAPHLERLKVAVPTAFSWLIGARGAELLAKDFSKATAVDRELARQPTGIIPCAIGDDLFDRPAIEAAIRAGGFGVVVGDACGWIKEIESKPGQVVHFATPEAFRAWILSV